MAKIYANIIRAGRKTLDDVPVKLREEVEKLLKLTSNEMIEKAKTETELERD